MLCCILLFLLVYNNSAHYHRTIGKVEAVSRVEPPATGEKDRGSIRHQKITLVIENGKDKGKVLEVQHRYDKSLVYDNRYGRGDFVFLSDSGKEITGVKQDYIIAAAFLLLFALLIIFGKRQGLLTILCLVVNVGLIAVLINLYMAGWDVLGLAIGFSMIFAFLVLLLIGGPTKNTLIAFGATMGATGVVALISLALIWTSKDIGYEFLDFLPQPYTTAEANRFFLAQVIIGSLGAILDVAVTITACAAEILRKTPKIKTKALVDSVKEVADDITGTMINVVFFTNVAITIPVFVVSMANDVRFSTVVRSDAYFDIARFLTAGIGVLIAIPFSVFACKLFMGGKKK